MLDLPMGMTHFEYRKVTHDPLTAFFIGYVIDGWRGARDALQHLLDDEIFNKMLRFF